MAKNLVIVESPSKAKTIEKILGSNYEVTASNGHVIDLPKTKIGIEIENNFKPHYQVIRGKKEILEKLKSKAKKADKVFLASDQDREGEAIAWHISNYINQPSKIKRITFNEITEKSVKNAIKNPRDIDNNLVNAQQARRLLDRIVGYKISPLLWKTVNKDASAGRVQSVALKLICDLEDTIQNFKPEKYWEVSVTLKELGILNLFEIDGEKVDKIFDENIINTIKKEINKDFVTIENVEIKNKSQRPPQVFKTSTLQQLASSYLGFGASRTMRIAQQLYEGISINGENKGLITYMRTDSTRIADDALNQVKAYINKNFGKEYVGNYKQTKSKSSKIQDAHEGIRPTDINLDPELISGYLSTDQYKLYKLIWSRFLVSQFAAVKYEQMKITASCKEKYKFRGTINKIIFDGYYKIFKEEDEIKTADFPKININDVYDIEKLNIDENMTKPPTRYSESTLVKKLESEGIGRPSTYASIIETLKSKEYVELIEKRFHPTLNGYSVKNELEKHFNNIINIKFTANMEEDLDKVEEGEVDWVHLLKEFYKKLEKLLDKYSDEIKKFSELRIESDVMDSNNKPMILKTGIYGKYLISESNPKETIQLKGVKLDESGLISGKIHVKEEVDKILLNKNGRLTDYFTEDGSRYLLKVGRYGEYLESENYKEDGKRMPLHDKIKEKLKKGQIKSVDNVLQLKEFIEDILNEEKKIIEEAGKCEKCGNTFEIKKGRFGLFLACKGYPDCKNIKSISKKTNNQVKKKTKSSTKSKTNKTTKGK